MNEAVEVKRLHLAKKKVLSHQNDAPATNYCCMHGCNGTEVADLFYSFISYNNVELPTQSPVSYTHLDVYKRQSGWLVRIGQ